MPTERGTRKRSNMPQIHDLEAFIQAARSRGVDVQHKTVDPTKLKPTQARLNHAKVKVLAAKVRKGETLPPTVTSRTGRVIDGHHRWAAHVVAGKAAPTVEVQDSTEKVMRLAKSLTAACHAAACAPPPVGTGGSSPVGSYGLTYDPKGERTVERIRKANIDWESLPTETVPHAQIRKLHANEPTVRNKPIQKVVGGTEPFREGYTVRLFQAADGELHVVDGHHRLAMYSALGKDVPVKVHRETLQDKVLNDGGFTLSPTTGKFVETGIAVGVPGHSAIIKASEFSKPGVAEKFFSDYMKKLRKDKASGRTHVGGWFDREHGEIVLDRVDLYTSVQDGIKAGRDRGEQAVYNLDTGEEISTGGTGGREAYDIIGS